MKSLKNIIIIFLFITIILICNVTFAVTDEFEAFLSTEANLDQSGGTYTRKRSNVYSGKSI